MNDVADIRASILEGRESAERIRVRGLVQGVGFRPAVWRLAHRHGLRGWVANDGEGVAILVCGPAGALHQFARALEQDRPPLARIDAIEREPAAVLPQGEGFRIVESFATGIKTGVVPDAATCPACVAEIFDPGARRYRYPFTNCTHCGPRLSIIEAIPYDRAATTMRTFALCAACNAEYDDPNDRRFHAQPIACTECGPRAWLTHANGAPIAPETYGGQTALDAVDAACTLLQNGHHIVAVKGLGGFQLACDATDEVAVARLRSLKRREGKPFALMARDIAIVRRYCRLAMTEEELLQSSGAPIVIMEDGGGDRVAPSVAPGMRTLGFMLPNTPLHHLLLWRMNRPIVLTSGNLTDEPQCIGNADALARLGGIADYFLLHDRDIARRVDDSVVRRMAGNSRMLRRARGFAPATIPLPLGFAAAPAVLGMGGELKNTFCLVRDGQAIVSHHMGDLEDALTYADYSSSLASYLQLFEHDPRRIAVDMHPEYLSAKLGEELAQQRSAALTRVQHHHAHIAACMAENGYAIDAAPVLGVALDGLGYGSDGALWGGEFLLADYRSFRRLGTFKPVAMLGGEQAIHEPWRNTYAHLMAGMGWPHFTTNYSELDLYRFLSAKNRPLLDAMAVRGINSPAVSSCGRLFDAVAAAVGVCRERAHYEGQAAIEFEALVDEHALSEEDGELAYPFTIASLRSNDLPYIEPLAMWQALLGDLLLGTPAPVIAARFHKGLAMVIARMVEQLRRHESGEGAGNVVALSGGVFQNCVLLEQVSWRLEAAGFHVLAHRRLPANDGGLALGQAAVAAARSLAE